MSANRIAQALREQGDGARTQTAFGIHRAVRKPRSSLETNRDRPRPSFGFLIGAKVPEGAVPRHACLKRRSALSFRFEKPRSLPGTRLAAICLAASSVTLAPTWASAEDPHAPEAQIAPLGYHEVKQIRLGLVIAGASIFGTTYLATAVPSLIVAGQGAPEAAVGAIPVAGPFALLGLIFRPSPSGDNNFDGVGFIPIFVADGLLQAAGAAMLIAGIVSPKRVMVPDNAKVHIVPVTVRLGKAGAGVGVAGTF
jgi:hypothetical protein